MSTTPEIVRRIGKWAYFLLLPLLTVYGLLQKRPRTRAVIFHNDKILLVKNLLSVQDWTLPGGGVNKNERSSDAVVREVQEEVGIIVKTTPSSLFTTKSPEQTSSFIVEVFLMRLDEEPAVTIDGKEIIDYQWVEVNSRILNKNPKLKAIVDRAVRMEHEA